MKTRLPPPLATLALVLGLVVATGAAADCFADYKAKQDNPLRLQYGIVELPPQACADQGAARAHVRQVVERSGWTLLQIESIFGADGFASRRARAGQIHLRN